MYEAMETEFIGKTGDPPVDRETRRGGLWKGLCLGDKIGGPTQMAARLKASLESSRRFCLEDILLRYRDWWMKEGFDTGPTVERVFQLMQAGVPHEEAVMKAHEESDGMTAGCNPAHRATPMAIMEFLPVEELGDQARIEARLTHLHPDAAETSAAAVLLCRHLVDGVEWSEALRLSASGVSGAARDALLAPEGSPLSSGGYAPDVLRAAVAFVNRFDDFRSALEAAVEFAGASNYCPVLAGAIAGARWGVPNDDSIPLS
jgi:ADP-ribosylglycohydrolase